MGISFLRQEQRKKAVAYYRHSAEDKQENSVPLQREFVRDLLKRHNVELLHEEADEGVSGLTANRPGFQRLFRDWILNPDAEPFDYVVFYDVSRLGRFEDSDEAGHYAYECKRMGKQVIYARRGFPTEEVSGMHQVQDGFERWMSFQYSKKLSEDVLRGCLKISKDGYSVGGPAPYGMARLLLSSDDRKPVRILNHKEHKCVANERIMFVPKGDHTTEAVRMIFDNLLDMDLDLGQIADCLNRKNITSYNGGAWNRGKIYRVLSNPAYKGTLIYNKKWGRLKHKKKMNPVSDWVIKDDAFPAIINAERFSSAQERLYWLLPSKYLKGLHTIQKAKRGVLSDIRSVLKKADINPENARSVPLSFAARRHLPDLTSFWCFFISREVEKYKNVLCISVDIQRDDSIDRAFLVPTNAFDLNGMCVFGVKDDLYSRSLLKEEEMELAVVSLLKQELISTVIDSPITNFSR